MYDGWSAPWSAGDGAAALEQRAAELDRLAGALRREAESLDTVLAGVRGRLTPAVWTGPAADRAAADAGEHTAALRTAAGGLLDIAARLEAEARDLRDRAAAIRAEAERDRRRAEERAAATTP